MEWDAAEFQSQIKARINPCKNVYIKEINCSTVALNELIALISVNIDFYGLRELRFDKFPDVTDLDSYLLDQISQTTKKLRVLELNLMKNL